MGTRVTDAYGHVNPVDNGITSTGAAAAQLTAGAVSTTAVATIAPTTNAGANPTVTIVQAWDMAGTFTLSPVTGGGAQAAGALAVVTFAQPLSKIPSAVVCSIVDNAGDVVIASAVKLPTITGFSICGAILTTAHNYTVMYQVIP